MAGFLKSGHILDMQSYVQVRMYSNTASYIAKLYTGDYVKCIIQQLKIHRSLGTVPVLFPSGTVCRENYTTNDVANYTYTCVLCIVIFVYAYVAELLRLVRFWPDHFSGRFLLASYLG